jgi:predicted acylesterase/phospholipase RssA
MSPATLRLSLSGAGFMGVWHLGVVRALAEAGQLHACELAGASAGALVGAVAATGAPLSSARSALAALATRARALPLGVLTPGYSLVEDVRAELDARLPADAHTLASGRLHVALVSLRSGEVGRTYHKASFGSRDELIASLCASADVPGFTGLVRARRAPSHPHPTTLASRLVSLARVEPAPHPSPRAHPGRIKAPACREARV